VGIAEPAPEGLLARARELAARAHAPYSGVRVGAVAVGASGGLHDGVNVESASYGLTLCAERAAIARLLADGDEPILRIAVARGDGEPIVPCGACRQVLAEAGTDVVVVLEGPRGPIERPISELLPDPFLLP
jgi:cytidine deaminase